MTDEGGKAEREFAQPMGRQIGDGERDTSGAEADAPVLVSRDLARRMAAYAKLLPRQIAEENESIVLDAADASYVVGARDPQNFLAIRNVARALRVSTRLITTTRVSANQLRMLLEIAYAIAPREARTVGENEGERRDENDRGGASAKTKNASYESAKETARESAPQSSVTWEEIDPRAADAARAMSERAEEELDLRRGGDTRSNANFVIQEAVRRGASDIHFEPGPEFGRIRLRIDGAMYLYAADVPSARMEQLINALADMANVNSFALPHAPCDASIDRRVMLPDGRVIKTTLRFASSPALYGVDVTIRLNINQFFDFDAIGFAEPQLAEIYCALKHKHGIILVTGETGSGKSNTLEAILRQLEADDTRKVIQVGDPIEFPNARRTQIPIKANCDWDKALKISLRKDPNIFSPGEFRDNREAQMVFRAGRTGHLVPTTVHTNDVATTFDRLSDLGIEPYNQGPALRLIISQQLVKKLCAHCKEADPMAPFIAARLLAVLFPERDDLHTLALGANEQPWLYRAAGCAACYGIGYRGRTVVAEVLRMTPELARMVSRGLRGEGVVEYAVREYGMMTMAEAAARKIVAGITSFDEVEHLLSAEVRRRGKENEETTTVQTNRAPPQAPQRTRHQETPENAAASETVEAEFVDVLDDDWPLEM